MPLETYTKYLPEPSPYIQGSVPSQDSTAAAIGAGLSGLATIFDMGLKSRANDRTDKSLNAFDNEIQPFVQSVSQGRMTSNDAMARTSAIMKAHIDRNPHIADEIRKRGQDIWGTNPSAEVLKNQQTLETEQRTKTNQEEEVRIKASMAAGIYISNADGTPNRAAMAKAGDGLARNSFIISRVGDELDNELKAAELETRRTGKPATIQERGAAEWDRIQKPLYSTLQTVEGAGWSIVEQAISANKGLSEPEQEQAATIMVRDLEANAMRIIQSDMQAAGVPFLGETQDRALKTVRDYFQPYHDLLDNKNFSNLQVWKNTHAMFETRAQGEFQKSSPYLARMTAQYGQAAVGAIVGTSIATIPAATTAIQTEILANIGTPGAPPPPPGPDVPTLLSLNEQVMTGKGSVMNTPNETYTYAQTQSLTAGQEAFGKNTNKVTPEQLDTWGNVQTDLLAFALSKGTQANIKSTTQRLSSSEQIAVFDKFAKKEPILANTLGKQYLALNGANINNLVLAVKDPISIGFGRGSAPGKVFYHALSGQVAWDSKFPAPLETKQNIDRINASLRNVLHFQQYGTDDIQAAKPSELKLQLMKQSGIEIRGLTVEQREAGGTGSAAQNPTQ